MEKIKEYEKFVADLNQCNASIYKWVYAKEIDYSYDPRYEED